MKRYEVHNVGGFGPSFAYEVGSTMRVGGATRFKRHAMSQLYDTSREAQEVADWLAERDAGYPPRTSILEWIRENPHK